MILVYDIEPERFNLAFECVQPLFANIGKLVSNPVYRGPDILL